MIVHLMKLLGRGSIHPLFRIPIGCNNYIYIYPSPWVMASVLAQHCLLALLYPVSPILGPYVVLCTCTDLISFNYYY